MSDKRKKNLCVGSVITLLQSLLHFCPPWVLLSWKQTFYICHYFNWKAKDQVHLKEITFSSMSLTIISELFQIIVEYTMIDAKVTSKLCFNWLLLLIFHIKLTFLKSAEVSQITLIVIASSIVSTLNSYFWIFSMQKKLLFKANWGSDSSKSSGSEH